MDRDDDTFTFENRSATKPVTLTVLANEWVDGLGIGTSADKSIPDPAQKSDYISLLFDKIENPKKIKMIRVLTTNVSQLIQPMNWQSRDANGELQSMTDITLSLFSPTQFQSGVLDIPYDKGVIVGLNQFFIYTLLPSTTVTMTFVYDDFKIVDLLKIRK
jgi:hypothetical protein